MNEKYGIELDLITAPFKQKMNDTKVKIAELSRTLNTLKKEMKDTTPGTQAFREYALAVEDAKQELEQLKNSQKGLKNLKNTFSDMAKSIDNGVGKIKKFAFALLSVRSAYRIISKAANAYLATNEELSNKMQSAWAGLGSMLAPILEWIANAMIKVVAYINIFIKALTGIDLLARATTKSIKGMGASAKSTSKSLAGFDTITNLGNNDSGGGLAGGIENPFSAFEDVDIDTKWADRITNFGKFIRDNAGEIIAGLTGIASALGLLKLGIKPIKALGIGLAITGIIYSIQALRKYMKDKTWKNFGSVIQGIGVAIVGLGVAILGLPAIVVGVALLIYGTVVKYWDKIKAYLQNGINWLKGRSDWIGQVFGSTAQKIYNNFVQSLQGILNWFDYTFNNIKRNFDEIISFVKNVFTGNWAGAWQNVKNIFTNIWNEIVYTVRSIFDVIVNLGRNIGYAFGGAISGALKSVVNGVLYTIENFLNTPIRAINGLLSVINKVLPKSAKLSKLSTFNLPRLATGTNYVPRDMTAVIHKGEAVIPKKFNSKEYFNGNSDETNRLLNRLIVTLENKDMNAYISTNDVGRASVSYINEQSRIMGRKLI